MRNMLSLILCILLGLISCTPKGQYRWCETQEGIKIWVENSQSSYSFSWDGDNIEGIANGVGTLTIIQGDQIISMKRNIYYGAIDRAGIEKISPTETYIGETESKKYNGFGVLIKQQEVLIGHFVKSNADGYCSYFRDGHIIYRGMWKAHQLHGEGTQYTQVDTICGIWDRGKLVRSKLSKNTKVGRFSGYIENNLPNGKGSMEYVNGWSYTGNWKNGLWNGEGKLTTPQFVYIGEWKEGKPDGEGSVAYLNGEYYDGYWIDGKREGWGDALNSEGSYYVGEWWAGEYCGIGTLYFPDNSVYDGQWQDGLQYGLGTYSSDSFTYVGEWEDGWINGEGRIEYRNGDYYEGHYVENKRFGLGFYHFNNGNSYEGEFVDDLFQGLGIFYFNDGSIYEGEFLNGRICGDGTYYYVDGNDTIAITAQWTGTTEFPSQASILFSNGDIYEGEIRNGKPTENGIWYPNESSWFHNKLVSANDCYKLHKETIDKAILITSLSLLVVATAATAIASAGAGAPALAASVSALSTVANTANTISTVVNATDIAVTISSAVIDENWGGVAKEVALNAVFILVPKGVTKALKSDPTRKMAVKLSESAATRVLRKSAITITKSKPFKKVATIVVEKSGKIKEAFVSSTRKNLEKFSKSKFGQRIAQRQLSKKMLRNKKIVEKFASKLKMTKKLKNELLDDIKLDDELGELIRKNPEFNIKRWLNTRKKVNKQLIAQGARNRQYAGKVFYFHPSLNKNIQSTLRKKGSFSNYTKQQLLELDKMFPNGVPYTQSGFPDFIAAGACKLDKNGKLIKISMPNGMFTGDRNKDFEIARKCAEKLYGTKINESGYIWHHLEGSPASMVLVRTACHEVCRHTGGHALNKILKNGANQIKR